MFRSTTIIRELVLNMAKVIFMLKHLVKLRRYVIWWCQHVTERPVCCVLCRMHSTQHTHTHTHTHTGN